MGCGGLILDRLDGGAGAVDARQNEVSLTPRGARVVWRHVTYHPACFTARVRWHRKRAGRLLVATGAGTLAAVAGLWLTEHTLLPAALFAGLGTYAAYLEATDTRAAGS